MSKFNSPLNDLKVASPCPANWDEMYGDNRKRFCGECKLNVYNLSGMTRPEAESLIMKAEGRMCVRYFTRADGTVITQDCPVGWEKIKQRTKVYATAAFSLVMALFSGLFFVSLFAKQKATIGDLRIPYTTPTPPHTMGAIAVPQNTNSNTVKPTRPDMTMGKIALPANKQKPVETKGEMIEIRRG